MGADSDLALVRERVVIRREERAISSFGEYTGECLLSRRGAMVAKAHTLSLIDVNGNRPMDLPADCCWGHCSE